MNVPSIWCISGSLHKSSHGGVNSSLSGDCRSESHHQVSNNWISGREEGLRWTLTPHTSRMFSESFSGPLLTASSPGEKTILWHRHLAWSQGCQKKIWALARAQYSIRSGASWCYHKYHGFTGTSVTSDVWVAGRMCCGELQGGGQNHAKVVHVMGKEPERRNSLGTLFPELLLHVPPL